MLEKLVKLKLRNVKLIGMQDQYATAYGGLNRFEFYKNNVIRKKINLNTNMLNNFNDYLHLFYTGINRQAHKILLNVKKSEISLLIRKTFIVS